MALLDEIKRLNARRADAEESRRLLETEYVGVLWAYGSTRCGWRALYIATCCRPPYPICVRVPPPPRCLLLRRRQESRDELDDAAMWTSSQRRLAVSSPAHQDSCQHPPPPAPPPHGPTVSHPHPILALDTAPMHAVLHRAATSFCTQPLLS